MEGNGRVVSALLIRVPNRHRIDLHAGIDRRLQQEGKKRAHIPPLRGRAFREQRNAVAFTQKRSHLSAHPPCICLACTIEE